MRQGGRERERERERAGGRAGGREGGRGPRGCGRAWWARDPVPEEGRRLVP